MVPFYFWQGHLDLLRMRSILSTTFRLKDMDISNSRKLDALFRPADT